MWNAKAPHIFFSTNISVYAIFNDHSFNDTLTNDIVSFEQLGPGLHQNDLFSTNGKWTDSKRNDCRDQWMHKQE